MSPLGSRLGRVIDATGPITVARYMAEALGHPEHGYYMRGDPFGRGGDFVTAPEISQMFGEMIGLWCAATWQQAGAPVPVHLVELGPGRGTLMSDALRAARGVPAFFAALCVNLVETSPALRVLQRRALNDARVAWFDDFAAVPEGPVLVIANEFFDALPVHQFQRTRRGWCERFVDRDPETGGFRFVLSPAPTLASRLIADTAAPIGSVAETRPAGLALARDLARRVAGHGGAAIIVDYGYGGGCAGNTFQAVRGHRPHPPLVDPGEADLTAHVDFAALAEAARQGGADVHGPIPQGTFLAAIGIGVRARSLAAAAPAERSGIAADLARLTDAEAMGQSFKVMAITAAGAPPPAGFGGVAEGGP